ncbi:VWA domain-containing protein [Sulfurimonas sp.]|jgi:Ca-activated chloride channel family protein|uniref:vWA domain-containing protein n=1 Tax=Sulfurimonas sp. TaxID=2022749 RepID=UPI002A366BFB|nr:VWA domain-containing protein [Sulfurimonas sp.]MDY0124060.1 VWA domain-containing protein [Sulfurimonas sp.]
MTFLHPEFLYYMLPPLFILFGLLLTQKEQFATFFAPDVMDRLRASTNSLTLKARNALFFLMGFFMIVALAQPAIKEGLVEVKAKSADIMIAIDISDSMLAPDIYPNRLEAAKSKVLTLLAEAPNERIGIVAFAKNSYLVSPLSFDTAAVAFLLRKLDTSSITEKGTDFLSVLDVVSKAEKEKDKKYLLILSDGGDKDDFLQEIKRAKKNNITVFVLGIATQKGSPIKLADGTLVKHNGEIIISKLNENIAELATKTGGVYIQSTTSSDDIKRMFKEITQISEEKELKSEEIQKHTPLFYYPLAIALFILLIATSSLGRVKNAASLFVLSFALFSTPSAEAGALDFMDLNRAKEAYESGSYSEAANLYNEHAQNSQNPQSYYNAANAYYKDEKYKEAIESYKKAAFEEDELKAKSLSNLGNAYAKSGDLQKAIESYESSLEIIDDQETRENLEEVNKLLEEQKSDSKDGDDKQEKQDKEEKQEQSDKNQDSKSDESGDKDSSKKDEKGDKEQEPKEDKSQEKKEESDEKESQNKDGSDENKTDQNSKEKDIKEDEKNDENGSHGSAEMQNETMSDEEEQKWIKQLNSGNATFLYRLNDEETTEKNSDEKPW